MDTFTLLRQRKPEILAIAAKYGVGNVRVFGSVRHGEDKDGSDIDLIVDPLPGATLFDLGELQVELEELLGSFRIGDRNRGRGAIRELR